MYRSILMLLLLMTACNNTPKVTTIKGTINPADSLVAVYYYDWNESELQRQSKAVRVNNGSFETTIPVCALRMASVRDLSWEKQVDFVSDGSTIKIDVDSCTAISSDPEGIHSRYVKYTNYYINHVYLDEALEIWKRDTESVHRFKEICDSLNLDMLREAYTENTDNVICDETISWLENLVSLEELQTYLDMASEDMKKNTSIGLKLKNMPAKLNTAPGKMYSDIEGIKDPDNPESKARLSDYVGKGKYVLADFCGAGCGPCRQMTRDDLVPNYERLKDKVEFLTIMVWDETLETTQSFVETYGITWPVIHRCLEARDIYAIEGVPTLIIFAPDGTIVERGHSDLFLRLGDYIK